MINLTSLRVNLKIAASLKRDNMKKTIELGLLLIMTVLLSSCASAPVKTKVDMWQVYDQYFKNAKYVDMTHTISPSMPVWEGFGPPIFAPAINPLSGKPYSYKDEGFEATRYILSCDQLGTHIDAPAQWDPEYPAIDELPATYAIRPLIVISIAGKVAKNPAYHLTLADILEWEKINGNIPEGSVVFIRSDWSQLWSLPGFTKKNRFPGIKLEALKYLHLERKILFQGHEPLNTDMTSTLEGESWLMHNGYAQAEAVDNLDKIPEKGALVMIGYTKFQGGTGGFARFIAICPPDWRYGVSVGEVKDSPLPKMNKALKWDFNLGVRVRN
jgi:kynurenine formamidase